MNWSLQQFDAGTLTNVVVGFAVGFGVSVLTTDVLALPALGPVSAHTAVIAGAVLVSVVACDCCLGVRGSGCGKPDCECS